MKLYSSLPLSLSLSLCKTNFNILIIIWNDAFTSNIRKWLLPLLRIPFYDLIFLLRFYTFREYSFNVWTVHPVVKTRRERERERKKKTLMPPHDPTTLPEELHDMRNANNVTKYFVPLERSRTLFPYFIHSSHLRDSR